MIEDKTIGQSHRRSSKLHPHRTPATVQCKPHRRDRPASETLNNTGHYPHAEFEYFDRSSLTPEITAKK
jgi:hypothetical protein